MMDSSALAQSGNPGLFPTIIWRDLDILGSCLHWLGWPWRALPGLGVIAFHRKEEVEWRLSPYTVYKGVFSSSGGGGERECSSSFCRSVGESAQVSWEGGGGCAHLHSASP